MVPLSYSLDWWISCLISLRVSNLSNGFSWFTLHLSRSWPSSYMPRKVRYKSVWGFWSIIFMRRVEEDATVAWMDHCLIVKLVGLQESPDVVEAPNTWPSRDAYCGLASTAWAFSRTSWLQRSPSLRGWRLGHTRLELVKSFVLLYHARCVTLLRKRRTTPYTYRLGRCNRISVSTKASDAWQVGCCSGRRSLTRALAQAGVRFKSSGRCCSRA